VRAAVLLVDHRGLPALTMRGLGAELGVEAMSLYKHVANKDDILDGVVEFVLSEIEVPLPGSPWRDAMHRRATSARHVLLQHSWAIGLLESRGVTGPSAMRYMDSVLGALRGSGFSPNDAAHAFWLLDSYVYGQVIQETHVAANTSRGSADGLVATPDTSAMHGYPHLLEMMTHAAGTTFNVDEEFTYGLDLILDALERTMMKKE
jgi:AcrR family transcriptional regulator